MSGPHVARVTGIDPVAAAVAGARDDEREVTAAEIEACREAREGTQPGVAGATVTARIRERSKREE